MKLLPYPQLPFFNEIMTVLRKNHITSWQANDFWKKIRQDFDVEKTNINYQNVYRFVLRLERGKFLIIDADKNEMGCTTYSETSKMEEFRELFCSKEDRKISTLDDHCQKLKIRIEILTNQIEAIEELKKEIPLFVYELDNFSVYKTKELNKVKTKLDILEDLVKKAEINSAFLFENQ
ncbi:hypothetical protein [Acinetobacter sp. SWAC57]|uniref:hypothetical protein n=1 Tax=Acinetobacter sp. SWAC57 TaxID=2293834 RepID=UPI000E5C2862|nr:hypothetical protein [Acinetobacter sp. SWAC57]RGD88093.1 hypothetical protein DYI96_17280 [Acinetobacter sp. SWAC57]